VNLSEEKVVHPTTKQDLHYEHNMQQNRFA